MRDRMLLMAAALHCLPSPVSTQTNLNITSAFIQLFFPLSNSRPHTYLFSDYHTPTVFAPLTLCPRTPNTLTTQGQAQLFTIPLCRIQPTTRRDGAGPARSPPITAPRGGFAGALIGPYATGLRDLGMCFSAWHGRGRGLC